jgi:hypothetical protein
MLWFIALLLCGILWQLYTLPHRLGDEITYRIRPWVHIPRDRRLP